MTCVLAESLETKVCGGPEDRDGEIRLCWCFVVVWNLLLWNWWTVHSEDRPSDRSASKKRLQKGNATLKKAADIECSTERFCRHIVAVVETTPNSAGACGSELKPSNGKNCSIPKIIRKKISPKCSCYSCYRFNASERRNSPCCWEWLGIAGVVCHEHLLHAPLWERFPLSPVRSQWAWQPRSALPFCPPTSWRRQRKSASPRDRVQSVKKITVITCFKFWIFGGCLCCGGGIPFWQRSWSWLPCSSD